MLLDTCCSVTGRRDMSVTAVAAATIARVRRRRGRHLDKERGRERAREDGALLVDNVAVAIVDGVHETLFAGR